jgi:hypothetical protein
MLVHVVVLRSARLEALPGGSRERVEYPQPMMLVANKVGEVFDLDFKAEQHGTSDKEKRGAVTDRAALANNSLMRHESPAERVEPPDRLAAASPALLAAAYLLTLICSRPSTALSPASSRLMAGSDFAHGVTSGSKPSRSGRRHSALPLLEYSQLAER